jgi:hypothetical protein
MDKPKINYYIDVLIGIFFVVTSMTGLVLYFFLPSGIPRGSYQTFLNITKHDWSSIHNTFGLLMILFTFIHIILHFKWILSMTRLFFKNFKKKK